MAKAWRKVLYERFDVTDNYVDPSFLKDMKKNLYVKEYNFLETVIEAGSIQHQLCWVLVFVMIYFLMNIDMVTVSSVNVVLLASIAVGYAISYRQALSDQVWLHIRIGTTAVLFNMILCPILHTLTTSISTDTIYVITSFLLIGSWACHTYSSVDSSQGSVPGSELNPLSFNAGLMASLCLASRLPTLWHTFVMVNAAMVIFGLQPHFTCTVKRTLYPYLQISMTVVMTIFCFICLLMWISVFATTCFVLITFCINVFCPLIFIKMQRLKNNIHGPWDEARPT